MKKMEEESIFMLTGVIMREILEMGSEMAKEYFIMVKINKFKAFG